MTASRGETELHQRADFKLRIDLFSVFTVLLHTTCASPASWKSAVPTFRQNLIQKPFLQHVWIIVRTICAGQLSKNSLSQLFQPHQMSAMLEFFTSAVFRTVPPPKTICCSLTSLNTDGTITQRHTKRPKKCCSLLYCTQCKCYLHNCSLLPAQNNITTSVTALRVRGLPHHCNNEQIYHPSHTRQEDLLPGRCGGSYCK